MIDRDAALRMAIKAVGTSAGLAKAVGVTPQAVSQWKKAPAARAIAIEAVSGISRQALRPDLYPAYEDSIANEQVVYEACA